MCTYVNLCTDVRKCASESHADASSLSKMSVAPSRGWQQQETSQGGADNREMRENLLALAAFVAFAAHTDVDDGPLAGSADDLMLPGG